MIRNTAPAINGKQKTTGKQTACIHSCSRHVLQSLLSTLQTYVTDDHLTGISAVGSDSVSKAAS